MRAIEAAIAAAHEVIIAERGEPRRPSYWGTIDNAIRAAIAAVEADECPTCAAVKDRLYTSSSDRAKLAEIEGILG